MKLRIWVCAAFVMAAAAGGRAQVTQVLPTVVASTSEFNPWVVGLGLVCVVLAVLVILARNGKLGGASATVNAAAQKASTDVSDIKVNVTADTAATESAMGRLKASVEAATGAWENYHKVAGTTPGAPIAAPSATPAGAPKYAGTGVSGQTPPKRNPAPSAAVSVPAPSTGGFAIPQHLVGN